MPKFQPVNILGGCYADSDRAWSLQDTVNWLPEQAEQSETRTPTQFKTPPGLRPFLEIPSTGGGEDPVIPSKPVRGTYNCENKLFAAIGKTLYQVTNSGVAIPQGTIPGNTRVTMTHNQISQGNQLVAVNGSSGYVFNTLTQVYEKIVDEGFPGAIWVGFADGYILGIEPGRRFAFSSEPADALNYNTLDRFTSEYKPDLIVTGIVNNNELILLNETSYEFFENTGATQQPFRSKRIYGDVGCASRFGAANLDRTVFMFGADGKFYRLDGYSWQRISTRPIEQAIRGLNWSQAFCYTWDDAGHSVVYWTFPDGFTWGFDQSTQLWHRRKSLGLDRWRPNTSTQLGQNWYMGDFQTGRIWVMDWDYILEGDDEIESERVTGVLSDNQNLAIVNRLELLFATGQEMTVPVPFPEQPDAPVVELSLPDGNVGVSWPGGTAIGSAGTPPYSYSSRPGTTFPGNLGPMSAAGVIASEVPTAVGSGTVVVRVTDSNGLYDETTATFQISMLLPWLMIGDLTGTPSGGFRDSPDGLDWSSGPYDAPDPGIPFRVSGGGHIYRNGDELLAVGVSTPPGTFRRMAYNPDKSLGAAGWMSFDYTTSASGGEAAYLDGSWYASGGSNDTTKITAGVLTTVAGFTCGTIDSDGEFLWTDGTAGRLLKRDDTGTVVENLAPPSFVTVAVGAVCCGDGDVLYAGLVSLTPWAHKYDGPGNTLAPVAFPFTPSPDTDYGPVVHYSVGLGLWIIALRDEVAYGQLDTLSLSSATLPFNCLGIGSNGSMVILTGEAGAVSTFDLETFDTLTGVSGQDVVALEGTT